MFIPIRKNNSCWQMESVLPEDLCRCVAEQEVCHFVFTYVCKNYVCVCITFNTFSLLFEGLEKSMRK